MPPRATLEIIDVPDSCPPSQQGLHLDWDAELLEAFVMVANSEILRENPQLEPPGWLTEPRGALTTQGFVHDTMANLAELSGGWRGTTLAPNTALQSLHLCTRMGQIETHPFVQACVKKLPTHSCLATVSRFDEDLAVDGELMGFACPPPPARQVFR